MRCRSISEVLKDRGYATAALHGGHFSYSDKLRYLDYRRYDVLRDGETLHGVIEWYDKCCLKVNRTEGPNLLLYKPAIKYMYKEG